MPHFTQSPLPLVPDRTKWTFMMPQDVALMAKPVFEHAKANKAAVRVRKVVLVYSEKWQS